MSLFIADPPQWAYVVLGLALIVTGVLAAQRQSRRAVIPFAVAFFLMLLLFVLDRLLESPREEAVRRSFMMALAADAQNPQAFADQLADTFAFAYGNEPARSISREEFQKSPFWNLLKQYNPRITASGFSRDDYKEIDADTVEVGFIARGEAEGKPYPIYVRATYKRQSNNEFKLVAVRLFDVIDRTKPPPMTIPITP